VGLGIDKRAICFSLRLNHVQEREPWILLHGSTQTIGVVDLIGVAILNMLSDFSNGGPVLFS